MKTIWAPWRMTYIKNARKPGQCIFCQKARERRDAANLLLHRGQLGFVLMNLYPYNSGHLMVAPYAHVKSLDPLAPECILELMQLSTLSLRVLQVELRPEGFNIGINLGKVSGAGIENHLHLHIVPRWNGDTNFMPMLAETKVIPEHLAATFKKLQVRFRQLADRPRASRPNPPASSVGLSRSRRHRRQAVTPPIQRPRARL